MNSLDGVTGPRASADVAPVAVEEEGEARGPVGVDGGVGRKYRVMGEPLGPTAAAAAAVGFDLASLAGECDA